MLLIISWIKKTIDAFDIPPPDMRNNCKFIRVTDSGIKESHPHTVTIMQNAPNYFVDKKDN